jgi:hypothetical protein
MGLLDRIISRRTESPSPVFSKKAGDEPVFATKALRKFLTCLTSRESPVLLDLGAVVGSNVSFFGEQLGCKIFVENIYADLEQHIADNALDAFPGFLKNRFDEQASFDGILCWDVLDYLDRRSAAALAEQLVRMLRPEGALLGFFATTASRDVCYTKYIVVDEGTLKHRVYPAARGRQAVLQNRDIIRLFSALRVSDSFLLQNRLREMLFRKTGTEA